jgi:hypothetical protein
MGGSNIDYKEIRTILEILPINRRSEKALFHPLGHRPQRTVHFSGLLPQDVFEGAAIEPFVLNKKDEAGKTLLHLASIQGDEQDVEKLLAHPRIDINSKDKDNRTALVWASEKGYEAIVEKLLAHPGIDINAKDNRGYTALHWASRYGREKVVDKLLAHPSIDVNATEDYGLTALLMASSKGHETILEKLMAHPGIDVNVIVDWDSFWTRASRNGHENVVEKFLAHPGIQLSRQKIQNIRWKLWMFKSARNQKQNNPGSLAFVSLLPELLLKEPSHFLNPYLSKIETFMGGFPDQRNYHPNEAELLLMLKHPDLLEREPKKAGTLTKCLTSISYFMSIGAELSDETLKTWGDIGFLTHGFRFWRYDTVGGNESLFAQFGFQPTPDSRLLNEVFGKGFLYEDKASGSWVEFRRGYLLVSHPEKGTLVIRNSSPVFGRDLLRHPSYYLKKSLTKSEILDFDPRSLTDKDSILYREHYPNKKNSSKDSAQGITGLTNTLLDINNRYRKFKFDTEAFGGGEFKGHLSAGFVKLVQVLNDFKLHGKPVPDLAFVQPEFPIYAPYPFGEDASGRLVNRYQLTPSSMKELNDFATGNWTEEKYPHSSLIEFIKKAGVENRGELVMLEP